MTGMTGFMAVIAGVSVAVAVALAIGDHGCGGRLAALHHDGHTSVRRRGMSAVLASARAHLRGGGTVSEAFSRQGDEDFATATMTKARLRRVLDLHRSAGETPEQASRVAAGLEAVCRVNDALGCGAVRCLDVVADDCRRMRMLEDLRNNAFAMPRATVRLLSGLPAATLLLGEALGARPLAFLFGGAGGVCCLFAGLVCYGVGLWWMRRLLDDVQADGEAA